MHKVNKIVFSKNCVFEMVLFEAHKSMWAILICLHGSTRVNSGVWQQWGLYSWNGAKGRVRAIIFN